MKTSGWKTGCFSFEKNRCMIFLVEVFFMNILTTASNAILESIKSSDFNWFSFWVSIVVGVVTGCISSLIVTKIYRKKDAEREHIQNCGKAAKKISLLSISLDETIKDNTLEAYKSFKTKLLEMSTPQLKNKLIKDSFAGEVSDNFIYEREFIINKLCPLIDGLDHKRIKDDFYIYKDNKEKREYIYI